jgi:hypothetical protein
VQTLVKNLSSCGFIIQYFHPWLGSGSSRLTRVKLLLNFISRDPYQRLSYCSATLPSARDVKLYQNIAPSQRCSHKIWGKVSEWYRNTNRDAENGIVNRIFAFKAVSNGTRSKLHNGSSSRKNIRFIKEDKCGGQNMCHKVRST